MVTSEYLRSREAHPIVPFSSGYVRVSMIGVPTLKGSKYLLLLCTRGPIDYNLEVRPCRLIFGSRTPLIQLLGVRPIVWFFEFWRICWCKGDSFSQGGYVPPLRLYVFLSSSTCRHRVEDPIGKSLLGQGPIIDYLCVHTPIYDLIVRGCNLWAYGFSRGIQAQILGSYTHEANLRSCDIWG